MNVNRITTCILILKEELNNVENEETHNELESIINDLEDLIEEN